MEGKKIMYVNTAPVCLYKFLLEKPVLYTRPISLKENVVTNVKFLVISRNKTHNNYLVFLYGEDKNVNWEDVMTSNFDFLKLSSSDIFFLENSKLEWFLKHFSLK